MINAIWDKKGKIIKVEMDGNKESLVNEFGTILSGLMQAGVLNVDIVATILSKVVFDNGLDEQIKESKEKAINNLLRKMNFDK